MKLHPIENPKSWYVKLAYWLTKRQYGKVITPMKVAYARKPDLMPFAQKLFQIDGKKLTIPGDLKELIRNYVARKNGCDFCEDIGRYKGINEQGVNASKFRNIMDFENSEAFTAKEKVALNFAHYAVVEKQVSDEVFEELKKYFNETQTVEITWVCATECFLNVMNAPLGIDADGFCSI